LIPVGVFLPIDNGEGIVVLVEDLSAPPLPVVVK
jgi:hypothetical protein